MLAGLAVFRLASPFVGGEDDRQEAVGGFNSPRAVRSLCSQRPRRRRVAEPYECWHKKRPQAGDEKCTAHSKVPSREHGRGKRWLARRRDPDGQQQSESFDRYEDARQHLTKGSVDDGTYIDPRTGEAQLKAVAGQWLENQTFGNPQTYAQYESRVRNHIIGPLGSLKLRQIKSSTVQTWIERRLQVLDETAVGLIARTYAR